MSTESEENKKLLKDVTFDWNTLTMDKCVEYLEKKHMFNSSGESFCIMTLIAEYKKIKNG